MTITKEFIPLLTGIDLSTRQLPLLIADSGKAGPTVWITAAIHGDEVTGTAIIQSLFSRFKKKALIAGKVYAVPILNPSGFERISRREAFTDADLNRHFNGRAFGSTPERIAAGILSAVLATKPDYVIDIHTDSINSIPYTLVDVPKTLKNRKTLEKSVTIAQTLGFPWALDTEKSAGYPPEQCFTGRLQTEGVPAITIEIGWPCVIVDDYRRMGVNAIWEVFEALGMVEGEKKLISTIPTDVNTFTERLATQSTGIIAYEVKPGDAVKEGQVLGRVRNVFGEQIEVLPSPVDGRIFSHEDQSVTFPGLALFTLVVSSDFEKVLLNVRDKMA
ncbi:MAG: hypothetical protein EPN85_13825 [Bacteroidetes bacterium]|nr:MAG: hypothetical protein EPN85_13825 [Bacteroidota bacterium]